MYLKIWVSTEFIGEHFICTICKMLTFAQTHVHKCTVIVLATALLCIIHGLSFSINLTCPGNTIFWCIFGAQWYGQGHIHSNYYFIVFVLINRSPINFATVSTTTTKKYFCTEYIQNDWNFAYNFWQWFSYMIDSHDLCTSSFFIGFNSFAFIIKTREHTDRYIHSGR